MGKLTRVNEILVAPDIPTISGLRKNLRIRTTGLSATITVTADEIIVGNADCTSYVSIPNVSVTGSLANSGFGGLDVNSVAGSTWYAVYLVLNTTNKAYGLMFSLSSVSPSLPSGFAYYARLGWVKTDSTANRFPLPLNHWNNFIQYGVATGSNLLTYPIIVSGVVGTTNSGNALTLSAVSVDAFIPPTANKIWLQVTNTVSNGCCLSPNNNAAFNGWKANTSSPLFVEATNYTNYCTRLCSILLESRYIYAATEGSNTRVKVVGWEDS